MESNTDDLGEPRNDQVDDNPFLSPEEAGALYGFDPNNEMMSFEAGLGGPAEKSAILKPMFLERLLEDVKNKGSARVLSAKERDKTVIPDRYVVICPKPKVAEPK